MTSRRFHLSSPESLLIAGDSHIEAFGVPLKSPDGQQRLVDLNVAVNDVVGLVGGWPRNINDPFQAYWNAAREHASGRVVAILWGGNQHLANFLFAPDPPLDFVVACNPSLPIDEAAHLISEEAIRALLVSPIQQIEPCVKELKASARKVLIVGTPPPKEDDAFLRTWMNKEPHFGRLASQLGLEAVAVPLSPPLLRLKMWMSLQGLLKDLARRTGTNFVPVTKSVQTGIGYLAPDFYAKDVTHANREYGKIMLLELIAAIREDRH